MGPPGSFQILLYGVPLVSIWFQIALCDSTMQGIPFLRTGAVMLCKVSLMMVDKQVAESLPREDKETVIPVVVNPHESHDESSDRAWLSVPDNLPFSVKRDVTVQRDVGKLPRSATTGFHLDRDMSSELIGRDDVVVRDVAGERGRDESAARKLRRDEVFPGLPDKLVATSCCHDPSAPTK
jgi:hypothetical protein